MTSVETAPVAGPFRRADARRNHQRVFAAALEVFAELGLQATVPQVAERAGVSKATVYRGYPTKDELVEAIAAYRLEELERSTAAVLAEPEPYRLFRHYVLRLFESLAGDRLLSEMLADSRWQGAAVLMTRLTDLMEAAKESGHIRQDATTLDLRVVLCGMMLQLIRVADRDPALWRRYGELTLQALRP
ncbi:TetR/AcrR family transcriptional regulator [Microbispora sp. RL4-1S]|uniref:TetR/AcrR family transcriptional regulator n=1 Tax=Microbispora oryzae TaxID=2806554 RepID=A0A940WVS8_9ACTN|nr:TetR/AcrR family transcriptional regulator [Microbispora oryzae]MBP2708171.1 TetR/AcrR family transcriptional regulator [Microbispora oryzae]